MKKRWFNTILSILIGLVFLTGNLSADQIVRNHYTNQNLNLPLNQIGQDGQQQTKNVNQKLFQTDQVGDIGKQRQKFEEQGKEKVFQKDQKTPNPYTEKNVFVKHVKTQKTKYDYTKKNHSKKKFRFQYWMVMVLGVLVGLIISWQMMRSEKRERRSANYSRVSK